MLTAFMCWREGCFVVVLFFLFFFFLAPFSHHSLEPSKQHGLGAFTPLQTYIRARLQSPANPYNNIALSGKMKSKGGPRREVKRSRDAMQARRPFV